MATRHINSQKLVELRERKRLSQRELAKLVPCAKGSIERAERGEKLRDTLIDKIAAKLRVTPEELWDPREHADPVRDQFAEYLAWQREKLELARLLEIKKVDKAVRSNESIPKVEELFVEPYLLSQPVKPEATPAQWENETLALTLIAKPEPLVILGDPGSGKSTLATYLTLKLAQPHSTELSIAMGNRLPLLFILNGLKITSQTTWNELLESFRREMCPQSVSIELLNTLLRQGQAVLIFDGLDELGQQTRSQLREIIWKLIDEFPGCRIICTSRPVGYEEVPFDRKYTKPALDSISSSPLPLGEGPGVRAARQKTRSKALPPESEHKSAFSYSHDLAHTALEQKMTRLYLAPFDDQQIRQFAAHWHSSRYSVQSATERTAKLWAAIIRNPSTHMLARVPNILTIIAILHELRDVLPDGRAQLYCCIADAYLEGIDRNRNIPQPGEFRGTLAEQKRWLGRIAWEIMQRRWANEQKKEEKRQADDSLLLVTHAELARWIAAEQAPRTRWERALTPEEINLFLKKVQERAGLLLERGEGRYGFVHLSFVEYFAGHYLLHKHADLPPTPKRASALPTVSDLPNCLLWHEPFLYAMGEGKQLADLQWDQLRCAALGWLDDLVDARHSKKKAQQLSSNAWLLLTKLSEDRYAGFEMLRDWVRQACLSHALRVDPLSQWDDEREDRFREAWLAEIDDPAARADLRWPQIVAAVRDDQTLICRYFDITNDEVERIIQTWPQLTGLELGNNQIGEAGAVAIAKGLPQLTTLTLAFNQIGEAGAVAIVKGLPQLTGLDLWENQIGEAGAVAIAKGLPLLTALALGSNQIGDAGAVAIAKGLPQLTVLYLGGNQIGEAAQADIRKRLPNADVYF